MWIGTLVFAATYLLIAMRIRAFPVDRPAGALIGAVAAVAVGALTPAQAAAAIDHSTLLLLFAVMGMGAFLSIDGFFDRTAPWLANRARSRAGLMAFLVWGSGGLGALITNDAVCVLVAPLVVGWIRRWKLPRLPFLLALATGANTGSVATLIGNPQNMLCGSMGGLSFRSYSATMVPVAIAALAINHGVLHAVFRRSLRDPLPREVPAERVLTPRALVTLAVIAATVVAYTSGANLTFTALTGFVALLVIHRVDPADVWARIDWSILLFFGALFVAVDAFARSPAVEWVFARAPLFDGGHGLWTYLRASFYFLVGSNAVTNVPFILIVKDEMATFPDADMAWELLAMASTFAGNLTLLGSVANVIVAEKAREDGGLGFWEYLKVGLPIAVATTLVGTIGVVASR